MRLDGLKDFHNSMKINDVKRSKFIFTYSNVVFDVFFFTDEVPYKLCIGVIARNFYFELNVIKGYIIDINIGGDLIYMYLTKFTDYSFRVLIHLAKDKDKVFIFDDLSKELKISEHHLKNNT